MKHTVQVSGKLQLESASPKPPETPKSAWYGDVGKSVFEVVKATAPSVILLIVSLKIEDSFRRRL